MKAQALKQYSIQYYLMPRYLHCGYYSYNYGCPFSLITFIMLIEAQMFRVKCELQCY